MKKFLLTCLEIIAFFGLTAGLYSITLHIENQVISGVYYSFETLYLYSGWAGFTLLFLGLWLPSFFARIVGMLAFCVVCVHCLIFIDLDFGLSWELIFQKVFEETPLLIGFIAFLALLIPFLASLFHAFRALKMYFLIYLAIFATLLHILTLQKLLDSFYYTLLALTLCALGFKLFKHFLSKNSRKTPKF